MKKTISIFLVVILVFSLYQIGCTRYDEKYNNFDTKEFYASYKQDAYFDAGGKTAVQDGRIYYLSNESGQQGIHSMNADGSDVQIEIPVEDIRKLQVSDKEIYYSGFVGMEENYDGLFRKFDLFLHSYADDDVTENSKLILKEMLPDEEFNKEYRNANVWDFYYVDRDFVVIAAAYSFNPAPHLREPILVYSVKGDEYVRANTYQKVFLDKVFNGSEINWGINLLELNGLLFCTWRFYDRMPFFEADTTVFGTQNILLVGDNPFFDKHAIRGQNQRGLIITQENEIIIGADNDKIPKVTKIKGEYRIRFLLDLGDMAYIISDKENGNQSIYSIDLDSLETVVMKKCGKNERVLWLDAEKTATVKGKIITIWDIKDGQLVEGLKLEIQEKIVEKEYKTDVAGDWLFIYKFVSEHNADMLQYKVNMVTGEVNNVAGQARM